MFVAVLLLTVELVIVRLPPLLTIPPERPAPPVVFRAFLPLTVESVIVTVATFSIPPPLPIVAVLSITSVFVMVRVPKFLMPPPLKKTVLSLTVESSRSSVAFMNVAAESYRVPMDKLEA